MSSKVAIVVLNYKGLKDTLECIESLQEQTYTDFHMVVVENGSLDKSAKKLQTLESDQLTIMVNDKNLGFAGGVNTGIEWALSNNYNYIALFNNDATADRDWLRNLISSARKHKSGITTGLLLNNSGEKIDSTGEQYSIWGLAFPRSRGNNKEEAPDGGFVFGATGGSSLYSVKMLREIGLFDEVFFAYYEDVDVSFRAQLAGWKVVYTPDAIAYHKQGATTNRIPGLAIVNTFKNLPLLFKKNVPLGLLLPIGIRFVFAYLMMLANAIKRGQGKYALKGWMLSIFYTPRAIWLRYGIQRSRKVSNEYLKSILWDDLPPDQTGLRNLRRFFTKK